MLISSNKNARKSLPWKSWESPSFFFDGRKHLSIFQLSPSPMQLMQDIAKAHILFTFSALTHLRHRKCSDPSHFGALQGNWMSLRYACKAM